MKIVKLGGSVITEKSKSKRLRKDVLNRLCAEIARSGEKVIVVHGAGSFGHILAKKYDLQNGLDPKRGGEQAGGVAQVQRDMRVLDLAVIDSLITSGLRPVSIPPSAAVRCDNKKITKLDHTLFEDYLEMGLTPVSFGDVVLDTVLGFCVCSGDQIIEALCDKLGVSEVIFATDVDGVFTHAPGTKGSKLIPEISPRYNKDLSCSRTLAPDVTGGMDGKVRTARRIAKLGIPSAILNGNSKDRLLRALKGQRTVCTVIRGGER
jgi:isopentenyl phosphate kinase